MNKSGSLSKGGISAGQFVTLAVFGLFSPIIRLIPKQTTLIAGWSAFLSPVAALPVVLLLFLLIRSFWRRAQEGEGLGDVVLRILGRFFGRIFCAVFLLWIIFYGAVILRSSGERLLSTIYPGGTLWVFLPIMLLLALMGAWGKLKNLANSAQIFFKLLIFIILAIIILTLPQIDKNNLLPITPKDALPISVGGFCVANVISPFLYVLFLGGNIDRTSEKSFRPLLLALLFLLLIIFLLSLTIIGNFGSDFTNNMLNPFFSMMHNIKIFNTVERFEAVVVALWVLTDFIYLATLLWIAKTLTAHTLNLKKPNLALPFIAAAVFFAGMFMGQNSFSFIHISEKICPLINALFTFILLPAVWVIGKLRKRI